MTPEPASAPPSDRDLLALAAQGNRTAFDRLTERHRPDVLRIAHMLLGNHHDAEEAAQETFIRAWRSLSRLRDPSRFAAWLGRIARTQSASLAGRWHQASLPIDGLVDTPAELSAPRDRVAHAAQDAVRDAIAQLTAPNRAATELHYLAGYSIQEVAALLAVPSGTVKRRLHDSRAHLRRRLRPPAPHDRHLIPPTTQENEAMTPSPSLTLDSRTLATALARVVSIPGRPDRGPALNGVHLSRSENRLTVSAADGFRIGRFTLTIQDGSLELEDALVPISTARGLLSFLRSAAEPPTDTTNSEPLLLERSDGALHARLASRGTIVRLPVLDETYPDLTKVIPLAPTTRITLLASELHRAVTLASEFSNPREFPFLSLAASPGQLTCYSRGPDGSTLEITLTADVSGAPGRTILSKNLLLPLLAAAEGTLELAWEDPRKPVIIREQAASPEDCWVIMPGSPAPTTPAGERQPPPAPPAVA